MLDSLTALTSFDLNTSKLAQNWIIEPEMSEDGRIRLPGFPAGLSVQSYLPLVHLYARILEASRILDRYRDALRLHCSDKASFQSPVTSLTPSTLIPNLYYKREDQTITKAYKVRGAVVGMAKRMESGHQKRFLTVSTGNHALGVLKAAGLLRPQSVRLVVPHNTAPLKLEKLRQALDGLNSQGVQADLILQGDTFDEARTWALSATHSDEAYLDPYGDPWVVAGQGTLGLELAAQLIPLLEEKPYEEITLISPVGGGGLLSGTATALKMMAIGESILRNVNIHILGLRLADPNAQLGDAIRVSTMAAANQEVLKTLNVTIGRMSDADMALGIAFIRDDIGETVEGASGGSVYPVLSSQKPYQSKDIYKPTEKRLVISLLSGANCG